MGADSGNEDDGTFIKKPVKKDRYNILVSLMRGAAS